MCSEQLICVMYGHKLAVGHVKYGCIVKWLLNINECVWYCGSCCGCGCGCGLKKVVL